MKRLNPNSLPGAAVAVAAMLFTSGAQGGPPDPAPARQPPEPVTRSLTEAEAAAILEEDWIFQADLAPTVKRATQEIQWARQIAERLAQGDKPPDLSAELRELDRLERSIAQGESGAAPAARPAAAAPAGLLARWPQGDPAGHGAAPAGSSPAAFAAGNFTLCAWIKTAANELDIIGSGVQPGDVLLMAYQGVARGHQWTAEGAAVLDGKTRVNDGAWHHVAQVVEGDALRLVVDGKPDGSSPIRGRKIASARAPTVGGRGAPPPRPLDGELRDVCVFNRALSADEIRTAFASNRPAAIESDSAASAPYLAVRRVKRRILFKSPELDFSQVLFIDQPFPRGLEWDHQAKHRLGRMSRPGGRLLVLDGLHPGGAPRALAPATPAAFWRPDLSPDARSVLFCMKPADEKAFHLYEIRLDGAGLRQLTNSHYDDLDPIYLPDGHILFSTTRGNTYIRCMPETHAYPLARCDADGRNIYLISRNNECDWLPAVMVDGRVIYSRWEYSDKAVWRMQSLWTINPDGTNESAFWGNQSVWPDHLAHPMPIPGSRRVMFLGVGHHAWFQGSVGILDPAKGFNYPDGLTRVTWDVPWAEVGNGPAEKPEASDYHAAGRIQAYHSPWPLSERLFLVSASRGGAGRRGASAFASLYLMDVHGNRELIYRADHNVLHAMPVRPRRRPAIPDRVAWPGTGKDHRPAKPGVLYSPNVYQGVPDLPRGTVKALRVIQQDYKTYSTWRPRESFGSHGPGVSAVLIDAVKRVLGTVPVAEDGSVSFEAPPGQAVFFQLLDAHGRAVHTMRSFTGVMPGETRGCLGCHELHSATPSIQTYPAKAGRPAALVPPPWGAGVTVGYERFVQPALDKHCGRCHQGTGEGKAKPDLSLRPGKGAFKEPYLTLVGPLRTPWVKCEGLDLAAAIKAEDGASNGRETDLYRTVRPLTRLSPRSRLIDIAMSGKHYDVKIGGEELQKLIAWVDCNAPYRGEEEIRAIPDVPPRIYSNDGGEPPILPKTATAPVIDRFNVAQDVVPGRDQK
jgi:hypothetical protein